MKMKTSVIFLLIVISIKNIYGASLGNPILINNEKPSTLEPKENTESLDVNNTITVLDDAVKNYMELSAAYNDPALNEEVRVKRTFAAYQAIQNRSRNAIATLGARLTRQNEQTSNIRSFLRNFFARILTFLRNAWARITKAVRNAAVGARHLGENTVDFHSGLGSTGVLEGFSQYPFTRNNVLNLTRLSTRLNTVVKRFREGQAGVISSLTGQKVDVKHDTQIHHANPHEPRFSISIHTIAPHVEEDHTEPANAVKVEEKMNKNFYDVPENTVANKAVADDDKDENDTKSLTLVEEQDSYTSVAPGIFYAPTPTPSKEPKPVEEESPGIFYATNYEPKAVEEVSTEDVLLNDMDGYYSPLESMSGTELSETVQTLEAFPEIQIPEKETKKFYKIAPYIGGAIAFIIIIYGVMNFLKKDKRSK